MLFPSLLHRSPLPCDAHLARALQHRGEHALRVRPRGLRRPSPRGVLRVRADAHQPSPRVFIEDGTLDTLGTLARALHGLEPRLYRESETLARVAADVAQARVKRRELMRETRAAAAAAAARVRAEPPRDDGEVVRGRGVREVVPRRVVASGRGGAWTRRHVAFALVQRARHGREQRREAELSQRVRRRAPSRRALEPRAARRAVRAVERRARRRGRVEAQLAQSRRGRGEMETRRPQRVVVPHRDRARDGAIARAIDGEQRLGAAVHRGGRRGDPSAARRRLPRGRCWFSSDLMKCRFARSRSRWSI
eukprot:31044-Pelagococcus_subviridis.AAC.17